MRLVIFTGGKHHRLTAVGVLATKLQIACQNLSRTSSAHTSLISPLD
jgi:hypothetical protein